MRSGRTHRKVTLPRRDTEASGSEDNPNGFPVSRCLCVLEVEKLNMKIEAITLREIHMPLVHFFETSFGRTYSRRILLVTVHSEGVDGWGESVVGEDPFYSSEWIDSAWPTLTNT